jgi:hypothetical protein
MLKFVHAIVVALSSLSFVYEPHPLSALSEEPNLSMGRGFICNTEEQIVAVATPDESKISENVTKVNARFGKDSCTFATALFLKGDEKERLTGSGRIHIAKIKLIGYLQGSELQQLPQPTDQYFGTAGDSASV